MAEINWALREDPATICLLEDAGRKIEDCCQITTFGRSLIHPEHLGDFLCFFPYANSPGKYYGEETTVRKKIQKEGLQPDYSYAVVIDSQVEFYVDRSALGLLARKYMPAWHSSSYARFLSNKTSAVLQILRVYKTDVNSPDIASFEKGRLGSYQVFKLYDTGKQVNIIEPLISDNRFGYLKDEIIHDLRINGSFIAEYDNTESGKKILRERISAEQSLSGKYDGLHQSWINKREQWNEGNFEEFPEDFDMAQLDYESIYDEIIRVCPSMKPMVEFVRNIKAARKGEYDYLLQSVHENNEQAYESAERIFDMSLRNAIKSALQAYKKDGLDLEDAFQEACVGIWIAIWKYHDEVQTLFPTYCSRWIMQNMQRYLPYFQSNCRVPVHYLEYTQKIVNELRTSFGEVDFNNITPKELYGLLKTYTSCDDENAQKLSCLLIPAQSIEELISTDESDEFSDDGYTINHFEDSLLVAQITNALDILREQEKKVIILRYGLNGQYEHTLEEVGQLLGVTRERIRQIQAKALKKLSKYLNSKKK